MIRFDGDFVIRSRGEAEAILEECGFLPFFSNRVPGFSLEEHIDRRLWFTDEEGPWEWKGPIIRQTGCAYGKFFEHRAIYVSRRFFPDLANFRRDGYDFDARYDDGLASRGDRDLYELLSAAAPVLSKTLKEKAGYTRSGKSGFETRITRLQAQCYVLISDFVYETSRSGRTFGWGLAQYSTPEVFFGPSFRGEVYRREPEESRERILDHLSRLLPYAGRADLEKLIR